MSGIIEYSKILIKRTSIPGVVPTIPDDDNDLDSFLDTDILQGELYFNMSDRILYTRAGQEIIIIGGQGQFDNTLLEELIGLVEKCCLDSSINFNNVFNTLNLHTKYLQELIKCCRYIPVRPTRPFIPGQAIVEIYSTDNPTKPFKPSLPSAPIDYIAESKKVSKNPSKLILYPVDKGYFSVIGMPGSWSVIDRRIVNQSGVDLLEYLPIYFDEMVCDNKTISKSWIAATGKNDYRYQECTELVAIRGYVIKDTSQGKDIPFLIYETKKNGSVKTFEASTSLWHRYAANR